jgi:hypothetical protein
MPNRPITEESVTAYLGNAVTDPLSYEHPQSYYTLLKPRWHSHALGVEGGMLDACEFATKLMYVDVRIKAGESPITNHTDEFLMFSHALITALLGVCTEFQIDKFTLAQRPSGENRHEHMVRVMSITYDLAMMRFTTGFALIRLTSAVASIIQLLTYLWERYYRPKGDERTLFGTYMDAVSTAPEFEQ